MQRDDTAHFSAASTAVSVPLFHDDIDVWIIEVSVATESWSNDMWVLADAEREEASRFRAELDRVRFVQRRVALRMILAAYLGIGPQDVRFTLNEYGKPSVSSSATSVGLSFNTSHSGNIAAIAVARSGRVGIDVEQLRHLDDAERIAARFFAPGEAAAIAALHPSDRMEGFFNAWTRKEALVKALGRGLSIPLDSFEVSVRPRESPAVLRCGVSGTEPRTWRLHHIEPAVGYVGAVASDREASVCRFRNWSERDIRAPTRTAAPTS